MLTQTIQIKSSNEIFKNYIPYINSLNIIPCLTDDELHNDCNPKGLTNIQKALLTLIKTKSDGVSYDFDSHSLYIFGNNLTYDIFVTGLNNDTYTVTLKSGDLTICTAKFIDGVYKFIDFTKDNPLINLHSNASYKICINGFEYYDPDNISIFCKSIVLSIDHIDKCSNNGYDIMNIPSENSWLFTTFGYCKIVSYSDILLDGKEIVQYINPEINSEINDSDDDIENEYIINITI